MANPVNVALLSHRQQVWAKNTTTGSEIVVDRLQSIEPALTIRTDKYYEIGRTGAIGATLAPPEYRISTVQNLVNALEYDWVLAGKSINFATAQQFNMGDIVTYANVINMYVLSRNQDGTMLDENEFTGLSVEELTWTFTVGGAITHGVNFIGRQGKLYTSGSLVHTAFGVLDDTSLGGIHGKDAKIWLTSGSTDAGRAFRLQSFTIRARFPSFHVRELGNRSIVGTLMDSPDVSVDFDLLKADSQVADQFFTLTSGYYDYQNPKAAFDARVRVFDPRDTEGLTTLMMFKIDSILPTQHTPLRTQVRQLTTSRYMVTSSKENVANTGGLTVSNRNDI